MTNQHRPYLAEMYAAWTWYHWIFSVAGIMVCPPITNGVSIVDCHRSIRGKRWAWRSINHLWKACEQFTSKLSICAHIHKVHSFLPIWHISNIIFKSILRKGCGKCGHIHWGPERTADGWSDCWTIAIVHHIRSVYSIETRRFTLVRTSCWITAILERWAHAWIFVPQWDDNFVFFFFVFSSTQSNCLNSTDHHWRL